MASTNLNRVIITGNLTRDPELRKQVEAGTTVALVGGTGSGKTTLVQLLGRVNAESVQELVGQLRQPPG